MHLFISNYLHYVPMCLDCYIIYRLFEYTLTYKYAVKYRFFSVLPILIVSILRYHLAMTSLITNPVFTTVDIILLYAVIFACSIFFHQNLINTKILWTIIALLIIAFGELSVFMVLKLLHISTFDITQSEHLYTPVAITAKIVSIFIVELVGKIKHKSLTIPRYARLEMGGVIGINLFLIIFSVQIFQSDIGSINKDTVLTLLFILCFTMSVLTFTIIFKLSHKAEEELEEKLRIQQLEMENKMNTDMTNIVENLRSLRHDMNNHIGVLKALVHLKQYDDLEKYLDEMYADISPANDFIFAHSKVLSALLYNKMLSAKLKQIKFEPLISITDCNYPDKDMCSLLGNLLDNAIEAAQKAETQKYIEFAFYQKEDTYLIQCNNTFQDIPIYVNGNFISTKKDKCLHGIGTKTIQSIVQKYGGSLSVSYTDLFRVEITLPLSPL